MACPYCDYDVGSKDRYCPRCAQPLKKDAGQTTITRDPPKDKGGGIPWAFLFLVGIGALVIAGAWGSSDTSSSALSPNGDDAGDERSDNDSSGTGLSVTIANRTQVVRVDLDTQRLEPVFSADSAITELRWLQSGAVALAGADVSYVLDRDANIVWQGPGGRLFRSNADGRFWLASPVIGDARGTVWRVSERDLRGGTTRGPVELPVGADPVAVDGDRLVFAWDGRWFAFDLGSQEMADLGPAGSVYTPGGVRVAIDCDAVTCRATITPPDNRTAAPGTAADRVPDDGAPMELELGTGATTTRVIATPDGSLLLVSDGVGASGPRLLDVSSGDVLLELDGRLSTAALTSAGWSSDGQWFVGVDDGRLVLIDVRSRSVTRVEVDGVDPDSRVLSVTVA